MKVQIDLPLEEIADWESDAVKGELDFVEGFIIKDVSTVMGVPEVSDKVEVSLAETRVDSVWSVLSEALVRAVG